MSRIHCFYCLLCLVIIGVIIGALLDSQSKYSSKLLTPSIPEIVLKQEFNNQLLSQDDTNKILQSIKKILYWNNFFTYENYDFGVGREPFTRAGCAFDRCYITGVRNNPILIEDFDAVIFHGWDFPVPELPKVRKPFQRYVFYLMEAPGIFPHQLRNTPPDFFNWSLTYRLDSDVLGTYGYFQSILNSPQNILTPTENWLSPPSDFDLEDLPERTQRLIAGKNKMVVWFVSKCETPGKREKYVKELSNYVSVQIVGGCGQLKCPKDAADLCYQTMEEKYKFYLSFENSLCRDYVTEKMYRVMMYDVVPIVYGGVNYSTVAPPGSYIDVNDFGSPRELSEYLFYLDANPSAYAKYFWWKRHYRVIQNRDHHFCELCAKLHETTSSKSYKNINDWYTYPGVCQAPKINVSVQ